MSDLIDRQQVINRLDKAREIFNQNNALLEALGLLYARELVESDIECPTVTGEHMTGEWIVEQDGKWLYPRCSLCKVRQDVKSNYCPKCGAIMKHTPDML